MSSDDILDLLSGIAAPSGLMSEENAEAEA